MHDMGWSEIEKEKYRDKWSVKFECMKCGNTVYKKDLLSHQQSRNCKKK